MVCLPFLDLRSPYVDVIAVIVLTTSVTRQSPLTASNARHIKIKRRKLRRHKLKGPERNKHGLMRKINQKTECEKPPQEQQTHDRYGRHTKPTLPTGAHSCCQLLKASFGFEVHWHGGRLHTTSSRVTSSHRNKCIHQQVAINLVGHPSQLASPGPLASWTNCLVTRGSTCVSPRLLPLQWCRCA